MTDLPIVEDVPGILTIEVPGEEPQLALLDVPSNVVEKMEPPRPARRHHQTRGAT